MPSDEIEELEYRLRWLPESNRAHADLTRLVQLARQGQENATQAERLAALEAENVELREARELLDWMIEHEAYVSRGEQPEDEGRYYCHHDNGWSGPADTAEDAIDGARQEDEE